MCLAALEPWRPALSKQRTSGLENRERGGVVVCLVLIRRWSWVWHGLVEWIKGGWSESLLYLHSRTFFVIYSDMVQAMLVWVRDFLCGTLGTALYVVVWYRGQCGCQKVRDKGPLTFINQDFNYRHSRWRTDCVSLPATKSNYSLLTDNDGAFSCLKNKVLIVVPPNNA